VNCLVPGGNPLRGRRVDDGYGWRYGWFTGRGPSTSRGGADLGRREGGGYNSQTAKEGGGERKGEED